MAVVKMIMLLWVVQLKLFYELMFKIMGFVTLV